MKRITVTVLIGCFMSACIYGCADERTKCKGNADCVGGYLCRSDGECVEGLRLQLLSTELPDGLVGDSDYRYMLDAKDGIEPYSWSMQVTAAAEFLDWLEIVEATGELRAISGQSPSVMGAGRIEVTVRDSSNAGLGMTSARLFDVECVGDVICYNIDLSAGGASKMKRANWIEAMNEGISRCFFGELLKMHL